MFSANFSLACFGWLLYGHTMGNIKQYWIRRIEKNVSLECSGEIAIPYSNANDGLSEFDYGNKTDGAFFLSATLVCDTLQGEYPTIIHKFLNLVICEIHLDNWTITSEMIREFADYFMNRQIADLSQGEFYKTFPKRPLWLTDLQNSLAIR
jgi:hypothetical protein